MRPAALVLVFLSVAQAQDLGRPRNNSSYVRDDDEATAVLVMEARRAAEAGDHDDAAHRLQGLLHADARGVVSLKGRLLFASPRRWAQIHLLADRAPFGPEVLEAWRKVYDAKASSAIRGAIVSGDEAELHRLLARFPAATAAPAALLALCDRALQRGDPDAARGYLLRVPEHVSRSEEAQWLAGEPLQQRRAHLARLRSPPPAGWPTLGGDGTRARGGDPVPEPGRLVRLWEGIFLDQSVVEDEGPHEPDRDHSVILPFYPVCDRDHVYVHLGEAVAALSRASGKLEFWAPEGAEADYYRVDTLLARNPGVRAATVRDGVLYFNRVLFRDGKPRRSNVLVAFDVERRRTLWQVKRPADTDVFFRGAPALDGERLYVCGARREQGADREVRKEEAYVFCFDRRDGRLVWRRFLGYGDTEAAPAFPPLSGLAPAVSAGVVVAVSGLGVAAALDARTGDILWLFRYDRQPVRERERLQERNDERKVHLGPAWMREPPRIVGDTVYLAPFDAEELYACWLRGSRQPGQLFEIEQWPKDRARGHRHSLLEYVGGIHRARVYYVGRRDPRPSLTVSYQAVVSHPLDRAVDLSYGLLPAVDRDERTGLRIPPELFGRPTMAGQVLLVPTRDAVYRFDVGQEPTVAVRNGERRTEIPVLPPYPAPPRRSEDGWEIPPGFGNLVAIGGFLYAVTGDRVICYGPKK
ncbi:MAG: outer membrane protein assembly factor BamB family protein [Planctomycetota bacterium]